jgi:hypothetical protein
MSVKTKIQDVFELVQEVAESSESANKFITEQLVENLATLLTDILKSCLEEDAPYPSLFETECKLYKSSNLKQRITTDLESVRNIIKRKISTGVSYMFEKIVNSRSLPSDTPKKIADILVKILVEVDSEFMHTPARLRMVVDLLEELNITLTPAYAYALYNRCTDYTFSDKHSLLYVYRCLSEEMRQKEMEASSAKSLALCVFGVSINEPYTKETVYSLLQHKGWESFTSFLDAAPYRHFTQMVESDIVYMCEQISDLTIIQILRENVHQFRPKLIIDAVKLIIRKVIDTPKPEYKDLLVQAYQLLIEATVLKNLYK